MDRDPKSHKGENGKVAVVGGSRHMHGAPIMAALAAEASGVDLIYVCLPDWHENVAKDASLNFQVHPFEDELIPAYVKPILELLATMDCAVLGMGVAKDNEESITALEQIIAGASCPLVLDATALQVSTLDLVKGKTAVLTPHLGELERMGIDPDKLGDTAKDIGCTILLKGPTDRVASPDGSVQEITGGNAGLTAGGTGDALGGLIAGLMAQRKDPTEASVQGATIIKKAAEELFPEKGNALTAMDVIGKIPGLLR